MEMRLWSNGEILLKFSVNSHFFPWLIFSSIVYGCCLFWLVRACGFPAIKYFKYGFWLTLLLPTYLLSLVWQQLAKPSEYQILTLSLGTVLGSTMFLQALPLTWMRQGRICLMQDIQHSLQTDQSYFKLTNTEHVVKICYRLASRPSPLLRNPVVHQV
jgi:hypothetical protein